jgi:hypothetical protein
MDMTISNPAARIAGSIKRVGVICVGPPEGKVVAVIAEECKPIAQLFMRLFM